MSSRLPRLNEEILVKLSSLIKTVKDPRVSGMVSITRVEATSDLGKAKVYISALEQDRLPEIISGLRSASGYLRRELGRVLTHRSTPELTFEPDYSISHGAKISGILSRIEISHTEEDDE